MERKRRGRGEGSIFKREDGTWCASVSAGYNAAGRRRRRTVYGKTKGEVQEKLREEQLSRVPETARITVGEYLDRWLEGTVKPKLAHSTYVRYEQVVRLHIKPQLGGVRLGKVEPVHIQHLYAALEKENVSARQRQLSGIVLQKALKAAVRLRLIRYNPCPDVEKPRPIKKEMKFWNSDQASQFLKGAKEDRLHAMYVLALATGMRQGELFGLQWEDIDFGQSAVSVRRTLDETHGKFQLKEPKTAKGRRRIDLPQFAVDALHEHRKAMLAEGNLRGQVFCDHQGGYLRKSNVQRRSFRAIIKRINKAATKEAEEKNTTTTLLPVIRFHDLRHTAATLLLLQGVHPKVVSERLGHASIEITLNTYSHVLPTMGKEAAAQLDKLFG
jgi:integrase